MKERVELCQLALLSTNSNPPLFSAFPPSHVPETQRVVVNSILVLIVEVAMRDDVRALTKRGKDQPGAACHSEKFHAKDPRVKISKSAGPACGTAVHDCCPF